MIAEAAQPRLPPANLRQPTSAMNFHASPLRTISRALPATLNRSSSGGWQVFAGCHAVSVPWHFDWRASGVAKP